MVEVERRVEGEIVPVRTIKAITTLVLPYSEHYHKSFVVLPKHFYGDLFLFWSPRHPLGDPNLYPSTNFYQETIQGHGSPTIYTQNYSYPSDITLQV